MRIIRKEVTSTLTIWEDVKPDDLPEEPGPTPRSWDDVVSAVMRDIYKARGRDNMPSAEEGQ